MGLNFVSNSDSTFQITHGGKPITRSFFNQAIFERMRVFFCSPKDPNVSEETIKQKIVRLYEEHFSQLNVDRQLQNLKNKIDSIKTKIEWREKIAQAQDILSKIYYFILQLFYGFDTKEMLQQKLEQTVKNFEDKIKALFDLDNYHAPTTEDVTHAMTLDAQLACNLKKFEETKNKEEKEVIQQRIAALTTSIAQLPKPAIEAAATSMPSEPIPPHPLEQKIEGLIARTQELLTSKEPKEEKTRQVELLQKTVEDLTTRLISPETVSVDVCKQVLVDKELTKAPTDTQMYRSQMDSCAKRIATIDLLLTETKKCKRRKALLQEQQELTKKLKDFQHEIDIVTYGEMVFM
jgi:hypothetical protein